MSKQSPYRSGPKKTHNRTKSKIGVEIVGWYGAAAIVGAYFLVSFGLISASSLLFQLLNLTGAIGIIVISFVKNVRQSVVLNAFWAVIAIIALVRIVLAR